MNTDTLPCTEVPPAARLLIHAKVDLGATGRVFASLVRRRLLALFSNGSRQESAVPLSLQIEDACGSPVFTLDNAGLLVEVALPAGTYHVNARRGAVRRSYTMTLQRGTAVDLYLRLAPDQP